MTALTVESSGVVYPYNKMISSTSCTALSLFLVGFAVVCLGSECGKLDFFTDEDYAEAKERLRMRGNENCIKLTKMKVISQHCVQGWRSRSVDQNAFIPHSLYPSLCALTTRSWTTWPPSSTRTSSGRATSSSSTPPSSMPTVRGPCSWT